MHVRRLLETEFPPLKPWRFRMAFYGTLWSFVFGNQLQRYGIFAENGELAVGFQLPEERHLGVRLSAGIASASMGFASNLPIRAIVFRLWSIVTRCSSRVVLSFTTPESPTTCLVDIARPKNITAGALIVFEAIKHAKELGLNVFDFEASVIPAIRKIRSRLWRKIGALLYTEQSMAPFGKTFEKSNALISDGAFNPLMNHKSPPEDCARVPTLYDAVYTMA